MTYQGSIVENTYIAPAYGLVEYIKRARHDYMSIYTPEMHDRSLLHFKRGFSNTFLVNKPEYIEHVFLTNQQNYLKTPLAQPLLPPYLGVTLLTSEGEYWRRQRRTAAPAFQPRRVGDFIETMAACTGAMLQEWERRGERPFDVVKQMTDLTLQIIARAMFSTDVSGEIETLTRMRHVVDEELKISVFDLLGLPQWLPRPVSKRALDSLEAFRDLVGRILEARRADGRDRRDLMSMLLAARDPETGEGMTDAELKREMLMMLLAGHDTVSTTLSITWYLLAQNPEVEQKLHEEIDRVLGGRRPVASDLAHLRYTRMVFEETMRLYPISHTLLRQATAEDRIGGVRIPAGSLMMVAPYVTHRNPNLWPDPERFDPERFTPEATAGRQRFSYMPFGGGPHICIGMHFGIAEAQIVIAMIAQRFRVRMVPEHKVEMFGSWIIRIRNGIQVTLEPRAVPCSSAA
jgi:cytochrome P450